MFLHSLKSSCPFRLLLLLSIISVYTSSLKAQGIYQNWGVTYEGGPDNAGVIFSTDSSGGNLAGKHYFTFINKGGGPRNSTMTLLNGKLYGLATSDFTEIRNSILFEYDPTTGNYSVKAIIPNLANAYGSAATGTLVVYNGQLYGAAANGGIYGKGELFNYDPATGAYTKLFDFDDNTGSSPVGGMALANNKLYGLTQSGGTGNRGVLFEYDPITGLYTKKVDLSTASIGLPCGKLVYYNAKLYGLSSAGGQPFAYNGTLFEYDPTSNNLTRRIDFTSAGGAFPQGSLVVFEDKLWGLTGNGGNSNRGVIFQYDPIANVYTKKIDLTKATGSNPLGDLVVYGNKLLGLTYNGGQDDQGVLFEYDPQTNSYQKKVDFSHYDGGNPGGSLTYANGVLYGLTESGGNGNWGTIFGYDPVSSIYSNKVHFGSSEAIRPSGSLAYFNKNLYGITKEGGAAGSGTIFKFDMASHSTTIEVDFDASKGRFPTGDLLLANNKLYGRAFNGGTQDRGVLFSYDPASKLYSKIFDFDSINGGFLPNEWNLYYPDYNDYTYSSLLLYNNKIYGTTLFGGVNNAGVLFEYDPATAQFTKKLDFVAATGKGPSGKLLPFNGKFYGITMHGGANDYGVLFEYDPSANTYVKKLDFNYNVPRSGEPGLTLFNNKMYGVNYESLFEYDPLTNVYTNKIDAGGLGGSEFFSRLLVRNNLMYGTGYAGGINNKGVVYEYNPISNNYTVKANFDSSGNGAGPLGNLISVPASIADGALGSCTSFPAFTIANSNSRNWRGITNDYGEAIAEINPNGNDLGTITTSFYVQNSPVRNAGGLNYLNRSLTINVQNQPAAGQPVDLRLYIKKSEFDDLVNTPGSGIVSINDLAVYKSEDPCSSNIGNDVVKLNTTASEWGVNYVLSTQVSSFSTFHFSAAGAALPVTLLNFKAARKTKNENQLDWQTSTEINSYSFAIERSSDGVHFNTIANLAAAGTSNIIRQYHYVDVYTGSADVFYRLKMLDKDGKSKYSKIVKLIADGLPEVVVSPNPVQNTLTIEGAGRFNQVQIIDAGGKIVRQLSPVVSNQYNVRELKQGVYILRLLNDKEVKMVRFIKL